ncbi:MAG TPA: hypothetical protein VML36_10275 [Nitrospiria bacterium]|nr:hypothetical protein [Nitrospiria bacterium]
MGRGVSIGIALMAPTVLLAWLGGQPVLEAREAQPLHVSIGDLSKEPERYDKQMVLVSGMVRSIEFQRGRRGSEYLLLTLEEIHGVLPGPRQSVNVVTQSVLRVKIGEQLQVRGVYYLEGNEAGRAYERFIDAEEIKQENAA